MNLKFGIFVMMMFNGLSAMAQTGGGNVGDTLYRCGQRDINESQSAQSGVYSVLVIQKQAAEVYAAPAVTNPKPVKIYDLRANATEKDVFDALVDNMSVNFVELFGLGVLRIQPIDPLFSESQIFICEK